MVYPATRGGGRRNHTPLRLALFLLVAGGVCRQLQNGVMLRYSAFRSYPIHNLVCESSKLSQGRGLYSPDDSVYSRCRARAPVQRRARTTRCFAESGGDLLKAVEGDLFVGAEEGGKPIFIEVLRGVEEDFEAGGSSIEAIIRGQRVEVTKKRIDVPKADTSEPEVNYHYEVEVIDWVINPEEEWVQTYPHFSDYLRRIQNDTIRRHRYFIAEDNIYRLTNFDTFTSEVKTDPSFWIDGTPRNAPPQTAIQTALLTAGELIALNSGRRGVSMVQLASLWNTATTEEPLNRPFVWKLLKSVADDEDLAVLSSQTVGNLGLTAIIFPQQEPFLSYAGFLASFGCQASVVAQSAYYKVLVGTILGYKASNIVAHLEENPDPQEPFMSLARTEQLFSMIQEELSILCSIPAKLPWKAENSLDVETAEAKISNLQKRIDADNHRIAQESSKQESELAKENQLLALEQKKKKKKKGKSKSGARGGFG